MEKDYREVYNSVLPQMVDAWYWTVILLEKDDPIPSTLLSRGKAKERNYLNNI